MGENMTIEEELIKKLEQYEQSLEQYEQKFNEYRKVKEAFNEVFQSYDNAELDKKMQEQRREFESELEKHYLAYKDEIIKYYGDTSEVKSVIADLKKLLLSPDVEMDECKISAYDLLQMVRLKFSSFRRIKDDKNLVKEVNDSISEKEKKLREKIGIPSHCTTLLIDSNGKTSSIGICFSPNHWIHVDKDIETGKMYYGRSNSNFAKILQKNFIEQHYDCLNDYFTTIEKFLKISGFSSLGEKYIANDNEFSYNPLSMSFHYCNLGIVSMGIHIEQQKREKLGYGALYDIENIFNSEEKNSLAILKKLPINIAELDPVCQNIVTHYQKVQNAPQLIKKNK